MFCKVCNTDNKPGAAFCENCGATLEQEPVAAQSHDNVPVTLPTDPGKTMNVIALCLGIAATVLGAVCPCSCGYLAWIGYVLVPLLAIASIILGIVGMNKSKESGFDGKMGLIGMILAIASIVLLIALSIVALVGGVSLFALMAATGELQ